ncbi:2-oxoacid:acceptor oxidoreductase family protein, partial [Paludisphaera soli]|uniref:2-oxoacid:acceptor oxidoreductase family protein n=1 Tax=Paludisphaera soli TaxID=2712865 RepID=UPI00197FE2BE
MAASATAPAPSPAEAHASSTRPAPPPSVNDLRIRVGTINGSGSQSSNLVLLRALHHMGVPCSGKNIFPSNIEGLPTWFHLRASGAGYVGHRLDPQIIVCMHEPTAPDDVRSAIPGSIIIYREEFKEDLRGLRDDVRFLPVPFQKLADGAYPPDGTPAYRDKLRKVVNMVYVGTLAFACDLEMEGVEFGVRREFPGRKAKAAEVNLAAARAGYEWAAENWKGEEFPWKVRRADLTGGQLLIDGNRAAGLGLVFGGATVLTWYPITPSSSLAEAAEHFLKAHRTAPDGERTFAVVQAEDELAAIGMVVGA